MLKSKAVALILILIIIALTASAIYFFNQQTTTAVTTSTRADTGLAGGQAQVTDSCGFIRLTASESPACPRLVTDIDAAGKPLAAVTATNQVAEYTNTFTLTNISSAPRTVVYTKMGFFCDEPYGTATSNGNGGFRPVCIGNPVVIEETVTLQPNESKAVVVTTKNASAKACGTFQNDIIYGTFQNDINIKSVDGNAGCSVPTAEQVKAGNVAGWGLCQTGKSFTQCPAVPTTAPAETCGMVQVRINVCTEPSPTKCGGPCDDGDQYPDCEADHTCVQSSNGSFCAKKGLETKCLENGNNINCCVNPTYTPVPTYTPLPTYTPIPPIVQEQQQQQQQQQQQEQQTVTAPGGVIVQRSAPLVTTIVQPPQQVIVQQPAQAIAQAVQPTYTPAPPQPTYTVIPTFTPYPTQPPQASYTPVPPPPPPPVSGSPIPFILAGVPVILLILGMLL